MPKIFFMNIFLNNKIINKKKKINTLSNTLTISHTSLLPTYFLSSHTLSSLALSLSLS